ncbi:MAG: AI-2E family transporter, partial [Actinobacteria bacterium]|nr:AI-2E family transporter [Actinomycetota bacterium]
LSSIAISISKPALNLGAAALSTLFKLLTVAVLSLYLLMELPVIIRWTLGQFSRPHAAHIYDVGREASSAVTRYMAGNFLTSIIAGVVVFVVLEVLGVPFAPLLALWVALVDLLPLVGGLLAGIPTVLVAFLHSPTAGIVTMVVFLVYQ